MKYEVIDFEGVDCFGVEKHLTAEKIQEGAIFNEVWKPFITAIDYPNTRYTYGVSRNFRMDPKEYDYMACAEAGTKVMAETEFEQVSIPGGSYAKFAYEGIKTPEKVGKFFDDVFLFSVTGGELEMDMDRGINCFELYDENYKGGRSPESISYLLIPIK